MKKISKAQQDMNWLNSKVDGCIEDISRLKIRVYRIEDKSVNTQIVLGLSLLLHLVIAGILAYNFL